MLHGWLSPGRVPHIIALAIGAFLLIALPSQRTAVEATTTAVAPAMVLTQHNDNARTGATLQESILNTSNVNAGNFGKLFTRQVDGSLYAQPLYVPNLTIPGKGAHNVVFLATMHNTVYAFDADDPAQSAPLWSTNLGPSIPLPSPCIGSSDYTDISTEVGILSTPVIDPNSGTIFVVTATESPTGPGSLCSGQYYNHQLHALNMLTGQEMAGSPVTISASVPGTGASSVGGVVTFTSYRQDERISLLLANGNVYMAFASYGDMPQYFGWVLAYGAQPGSASFLKQTAVFNVAPNGWDGGIWQSGQGLTADSQGNIYLVTGNGAWDGSGSYGDSVLKLDPTLHVLDWFTPSNEAILDQQDNDLGSGGVLLLPGTNQLVTGGKQGRLYLLDQNNLGHFNAAGDTQIPQSFQGGVGHIHGSPAYWNGPNGAAIYLWSEFDYLHAYSYANGLLNVTPSSSSSMPAPAGMPGGILSVSANGSTAGTGIVWASLPLADANNHVVGGMLRAFDASDLSHELWDSQQNIARDDVGNFAKFAPPTIANGKVYLGTFSNRLNVYGLLSGNPTATPLPSSTPIGNATATMTSTSTSTNTPTATSTPSPTATVNASAPLAPFRNNLGISHDNNPALANIDANGYSYSYEALQNAGIGHGGTLSAAGLTFSWPDTQPGTPDNVSAQGQLVPVAGQPGATTLGFLGLSVNGSSSGSGTITYTDNTTQAFTLGFSDWFQNPPAANNVVAATLPYRNAKYGQDNRTFYLLAATVPLNAAKTVRSITLPNTASLHIFALTAGTPVIPPTNTPTVTSTPSPTATANANAPLASFRNNLGISHDNNPALANIDANGYSYSYEALQNAGIGHGGTLSAAGLTFSWPDTQPGTPDNVSAQGQLVPVAGQPGATTLGFLGLSVNGSSSGSGTITYTDNTTQAFTLGFSDWFQNPPAANNVVAASLPYRNAKYGQDNRTFYLLATTVPLNAAKTVRSVTLPNTASLHIFALAMNVNTPLAPFRNNLGISHDNNPALANIDTNGYSYSYEALQNAGIGHGSTLSAAGLTFSWPDTQPGTPDNVSAQGQLVPVAGQPGATTLGFLGLSVNGSSSGSGTITYTDNTTQAFTLGFSDWFQNPPAANNVVAATLPYRNARYGQDNRTFYLLAATVPLNAAKTVRSITLPTTSSLHIFSLSIGVPGA